MFGKKIYELRTENKLTQLQLAKELGVSKQNISDWENGKSETSFSILIKLAKFFKVSTDYILGLEE